MKHANTTHGMSHSTEWKIWRGMKHRCYNPKHVAYKNYGGRGIVMCDSWKSDFTNFVSDMGLRPSMDVELDRIDVNGAYCKENCRWVTRSKNCRNKRTNNVVEFNGHKKSLADWAEFLDIPYNTIQSRFIRGDRGSKLLRPAKKYKVRNYAK